MLLAQVDPGSFIPWVPTFFSGGFIVWFVFVYLPAKEKREQARDDKKDAVIDALLSAAKEERQKEREGRHAVANIFQGSMERLAKQHEVDAVQDRSAFEGRSERTVNAIEKMGLRFEVALNNQTDKLEAKFDKLGVDVRSSCNYFGCDNYTPKKAAKTTDTELPVTKGKHQP